ncbi:hypothetical protein B0J17DRAFT_209218 [Rhizoctonia solani]|nr:hypothetical protein B0J17DRAFT_209218 [Rhizoctonia solani]
MANLKRYSYPSTRPVPIHEHLFRHFLDDLPSGDPSQEPSTQQAIISADEPSEQSETSATGVSLDGNEERTFEISSLILELHKHGLISTVQVYEYMFQLTTRSKSRSLEGILSAIYTLLNGCFPHHDISFWRGELEFFQVRVKDLVSDTGADQSHQDGTQVTNLLSRILNWEQDPKVNSDDLRVAFGRQSISVLIQPTTSEHDASPVTEDGKYPPGLNNISSDWGVARSL